jgi:Collagen triple helix repeat (20 copies)
MLDLGRTAPESVPLPEPAREYFFFNLLGELCSKSDDNTVKIWRGKDGDKGAAGVAGPVGATGATGVAGPVGATGATGVAGPVGATGATGVAGPVGATGATGVAGPVGARGATGVAGPAGATGATGVAGPAGATGATGVAGPAGATGATGVAGPVGATGAAGVAGPVGATGAAGMAGPAGATGATGAQGAQGVQGTSALVKSKVVDQTIPVVLTASGQSKSTKFTLSDFEVSGGVAVDFDAFGAVTVGNTTNGRMAIAILIGGVQFCLVTQTAPSGNAGTTQIYRTYGKIFVIGGRIEIIASLAVGNTTINQTASGNVTASPLEIELKASVASAQGGFAVTPKAALLSVV